MKILKTIASIFYGKPAIQLENNNDLAQEAKIAGMQLAIDELKQSLDNQKLLLANSEKSKEILVTQTMDSRMQHLFIGLASPLAQLALQRALASEGKEIKPENIFKLLSAIENVLEEAGLKQIHQSGEAHPWNPENMSPVMPGITFNEGENVLIRLPGYVYKGKYICKSLVDKIK